MKISKESILMLGFVIQAENPAGLIFIHPRFSRVEYVFWNHMKKVDLQHTLIEFATLEHFILAHQALTLSKLPKLTLNMSDIEPVCDPNTKFCLNQKKDA